MNVVLNGMLSVVLLAGAFVGDHEPPAGVPPPADPVVAFLRAIGAGKPIGEVLPIAVRACGNSVPRCERRLNQVLTTLASEAEWHGRVDEALEAVRAEGVTDVTLSRIAPNPKAQATGAVIDDQLVSYKKLAGGDGPPSRSDRKTLRSDVFEARLALYLYPLLGPSLSARTQSALSAAVADNCLQLLGGQAQEQCQDLGLATLQDVLLRIALRPIDSSAGRPEILDIYFTMDPVVMSGVRDIAHRTNDGVIRKRVDLLEMWRERRPSRFEAWAEIEELFRAPLPIRPLHDANR